MPLTDRDNEIIEIVSTEGTHEDLQVNASGSAKEGDFDIADVPILSNSEVIDCFDRCLEHQPDTEYVQLSYGNLHIFTPN